MKESYSEIEKKVIKYIVQKYIDNEVISTSKILYENWSVIAVERLDGNKIAIISEDKEVFEEKFTENQKSVFEIINILKYLEDHYLITVYPNDKPSDRLYDKTIYTYFAPPKSNEIKTSKELLGSFGPYYKKSENEVFSIGEYGKIETNVNVYNLLSKYIGGLCYPSTELKIFFDNKYKSPEQKRFDKTYCITKVAILVSIIIGLFGIFTPSCSRVNPEIILIENDTVNLSIK